MPVKALQYSPQSSTGRAEVVHTLLHSAGFRRITIFARFRSTRLYDTRELIFKTDMLSRKVWEPADQMTLPFACLPIFTEALKAYGEDCQTDRILSVFHFTHEAFESRFTLHVEAGILHIKEERQFKKKGSWAKEGGITIVEEWIPQLPMRLSMLIEAHSQEIERERLRTPPVVVPPQKQ